MNDSPRPPDLWLSENLEAIAIAIAMALILKFFVVEAYQIPTGSMQPTILGYQAQPQRGLARAGVRSTDIKDRVLADKLITMLRRPERWEVMIFRFPLDERRLYVKRIVGLPGETLELRGGDLWIDGEIARKPDPVNESVLKEVFPAAADGVDIGRWFSAAPGIEVVGTRATVADGADGELVLRARVNDDYLHGYDADWGIPAGQGGSHAVGDLDVSLEVALDVQARALQIVLESDQGETVFVLPNAGTGEEARVELTDADGNLRHTVPIAGRVLPTGQLAHVVARNVDHRIVLWVDGDEWVRYDDDAPARTDRPVRSRVRLALLGGGTVQDIRVQRDIFYTQRVAESRLAEHTRELAAVQTNGGSVDDLPPVWRWEIPPDSYFGMGDNTQSSHDSRSWETSTYVLEDGREIEGFWFHHGPYGPVPTDANPQYLADGQLAFADIHGDTFEFRPDAVVEQIRAPAPFIHERYLLGKAVLVFWPVWDPFRWKTIR